MNRIHSACRFLAGLARRAGVLRVSPEAQSLGPIKREEAPMKGAHVRAILVSPAGALVGACFVKWRR
jgi:hypothetical protein